MNFFSKLEYVLSPFEIQVCFDTVGGLIWSQ